MLLGLVVLILALTTYGLATSRVTAEQRAEMIASEEMFP